MYKDIVLYSIAIVLGLLFGTTLLDSLGRPKKFRLYAKKHKFHVDGSDEKEHASYTLQHSVTGMFWFWYRGGYTDGIRDFYSFAAVAEFIKEQTEKKTTRQYTEFTNGDQLLKQADEKKTEI